MAMTRAKVLPQAGENSRAGTGKQDVSRGTVEISGSATAAGILLDRHGTHLFEFGDMSPADCVSLALKSSVPYETISDNQLGAPHCLFHVKHESHPFVPRGTIFLVTPIIVNRHHSVAFT
jgi:hypothetical protein